MALKRLAFAVYDPAKNQKINQINHREHHVLEAYRAGERYRKALERLPGSGAQVLHEQHILQVEHLAAAGHVDLFTSCAQEGCGCLANSLPPHLEEIARGKDA